MDYVTLIKLSGSRKKFILEVFAVIVVFIFLASSALSSIGHYNSSVNTQDMYEVHSGTMAPNNNNSSDLVYVKYTLDLLNNTLLSGNEDNISNSSVCPVAAAFDPANGYIYVADSGCSTVSVINGSTNKVVATVNVESGPQAVAFDSANGYIYVANQGSGNISVINGSTNKVVATVNVGSEPDAVAFDSANGYIYVANVYPNNVSVIDGSTNKVVATIDVGSWPVSAAFDSTNGYIYVANIDPNNVSVIDGSTNKVVATVNVVSYPEPPRYDSASAAFDPANGYIYVANFCSNNVSVIDGSTNKVVATVNVGSSPEGEAFDQSNDYVYVVNCESGTVSILAMGKPITTYFVTFKESGLTSGTSWSVTLNGTMESSTTSTITFSVPNGTYTFSIGTVTGYNSLSSSGSLTVSGSSVSTNIIFTPSKHPHYLLYDDFVSDNYINTSRWSLDSSVVQNITQTDSRMFNENITLVQPNDFAYSFNGGLSFLPSGYNNMAGFTGNRLFTYPITVNVNFTMGSDPGGNSMIILSNAKGYDIAGAYLADQAYVQSGNQTPAATGYNIQSGVEYDLSMYVNSTQFTVTISSSQGRYSDIYQYSPSGNQTLYLTFGSFIGTFPGEIYSPTDTPEIVFQNASVSSQKTWNLNIYTNSSNGNPDPGVNVTITNAFTNRTESALSPSNGTVRIDNLYSGQYYVVATQTQGGFVVTNSKYIFVGEPNDPSLSNISLSLEISAPPPTQLCASIESLNSTTGQAPWNNTFIALPEGYVGNYTYRWYIDGIYAGSGYDLSRTFYNPNSTGTTSYKVSLQITSQGKWFGVTYSSMVADATTYQIVYSEPIYLNLAVTSPSAYASVSYGSHYDYALAFLKGQSLYLDANITDNYLSDTIPKWLMGIIGISYPFWGVNISNSAGNDNGIIQVLQPGSATYLNNVSLPGVIKSLNQLVGSTFDVTLGPLATFAVIGDVIQIVLAAIGVVGGLSVLAGSSVPIIKSLVDDLIMQLDHASAMTSFKLFSGSSINIVRAITNRIMSFLEDLLPSLLNTLYSIIKQYAPNELDAISGLIGDLGESISQIFPAWKLFDLGFDIGAVIGAAIRGNLVTQYKITSSQDAINYEVNDPGNALPYVQVSGASGYSGWNGSWEGNGYSHSSYTSSGYTFSLPSNGTSLLEITNPSRTSSMQYDLNVSVNNTTENLKGTLNQGSTVRYIVASNSTHVSIAKTYTVTFAEDDLPSGTTWYVNITASDGTVYDSGAISGTSYSFSLTNGTYSYTVSNLSGYSDSPSSGSITVNGASVSKTVIFSPIKKSSLLSGISSIELYGIIGALVAVAAIGAGVAVYRKRK